EFNEPFTIRTLTDSGDPIRITDGVAPLPATAIRLIPGSSWGMFTIACTIPIALFVGLYMYKIRPGKVLEASLIGGTLTIVATVKGQIFPFLFITIMCGAISGFHALVSSGTTPKMMEKETQARTIGYGAMLIEGLVGVVAMIAAASLPVRDYYAMNTELSAMPQWHDKILNVAGPHGIEDIGTYEERTRESLRGRTGGAVTLAVGMAHIFDRA